MIRNITQLVMCLLLLSENSSAQKDTAKTASGTTILRRTNELYNSGVKNAVNGHYSDAIKDFSEALKLSPADIDILYNRAEAELKTGNIDGACEDWYKIKQLGKDIADNLIKQHCTSRRKVESEAKTKYYKASLGYALPWEAMTIADNYDIRYSLAANLVYEEHKTVHTSFGKGINIQATWGRVINKNFSAELNIAYLKSTTVKFSRTYHYYWGDAVYSTEDNAHVPSISPAILYTTGTTEYFKPYFRTALLVAFPWIIRDMNYTDYTNNTETRKMRYTGIASIGSSLSLGFNRLFRENTYFFMETTLSNLLFSPRKSKMTAYSVQGIDSLSALTQSQIETRYLKDYKIEYTVDANGNMVENTITSLPRKDAKFQLPFGNWGIFIGIKREF